MSRTVLWFRNDLRLHDNAIVAAAVKAVKDKQCESVVPVYCFDPRMLSDLNVIDRHAHKRFTGHAKIGTHRAQFLMESVNALKAALQAIGSDLFIYYGRPEAVLPGLLSASGKDRVLAHEEPFYEERQIDGHVRAAIAGKAKLELLWGHTLFHISDLPLAGDLHDLPDGFTPFKQKVENGSKVRAVLPTPQQGQLPVPSSVATTPATTWDDMPLHAGVKKEGPPHVHPSSVLDFKGGEAVALARLKYYLWDSDLIADYFNSRNGMLGGDYSTKFSPWLALGCLSPRTIYHEIQKYEAKRTSNKSTYWVIFELTWRDFYRFFAVKHDSRIFFEEGITGQQLSWNNDHEVFELWRTGRTGVPLVDANMRELSATGFMSNRGRQNVASYLVLDLGCDWRLGADWFEHTLLDHDVSSNWGNWVAAAGLTGGRVNKFNMIKQSKDYDPEGLYIKAWLPELQHVPAPYLFEPSNMSKKMQEQYGVQIGVDYPQAIAASRMARPQSDGRGPENKRHGGAHSGGRAQGGAQRGGRGKARTSGARSAMNFF